ncbi:hypothetical protein H6G14_30855 [Nostoc parmelioides FACHB-3921]|uniref:CopG-like ribbon-helix-helix domain-containing protein n=2 Tax=Nostoc TaxID=1177 RepID=A0ABR8BNB4_9NOSO|nr:hypothetical protein [Nostoc parmelioides FACHB-3921]
MLSNPLRTMPSSKPKVQIRFEDEDFRYLEDWAKSEFIPITQLCRQLILKAAEQKRREEEKSA